MEPVDALGRIAYLLERDAADTYKVRAFRRAANALADLPPERLRELAAGSGLESLEGIGGSPAKAIRQALAGKTPEYLARLEAATPPTQSGQAAALREQLVGDCHSHSDWSDGGSSIRAMAEAAIGVGHRYLALTDHSPRLTVAHGLDAERLRRQLAEIRRLNEELSPFRILAGIEVDILEDGSLDQDEALLAELDLVVASVHSKLRMEESAMTDRMLAAVENPHSDILGHCTGRILVGRGRPPSAFDAEEVFTACARTGTAVEINSRPERQDPPGSLLRIAIDRGCLLAIDTDAHAPGQLEWLPRGCAKAVEAGADHTRIVNTWEIDELLGWTGRGPRQQDPDT